MTPIEVLSNQPPVVQAWLAWMFLINFAGLFFMKQPLARWVVIAMVANVITMNLLLRFYGQGHHLSIPHAVFWTPLLVYLFMQRAKWLHQSALGYWVGLLVVTDAVSLVIDYQQIIALALR